MNEQKKQAIEEYLADAIRDGKRTVLVVGRQVGKTALVQQIAMKMGGINRYGEPAVSTIPVDNNINNALRADIIKARENPDVFGILTPQHIEWLRWNGRPDNAEKNYMMVQRLKRIGGNKKKYPGKLYAIWKRK